MKRIIVGALLALTGCRGDLGDVESAMRQRLNRPCTEDDTCAAVVMPCDRCGCARHAILTDRTDELAAMARRVECPDPSDEPCSPCLAQTARCVDGVCALVEGKPENPQLDLEVRVGGAPVHVTTALAKWTETSLLLHFDLGPRACHLADDAPLSLLIEHKAGVWRIGACHVNGERWRVEPMEVPAPRVQVDAHGMLVTDLDLDLTGAERRRVHVRGRVVAHDCAPDSHPRTPHHRDASLVVRDRSSPVRGALLYTGGDERVLLVSAAPLSCDGPVAATPAVAGFRLAPGSPVARQVCVGGTDLAPDCHDAPRGVEVQTSSGADGELIATLKTRHARVGYRLAVEGPLRPERCATTIDLVERVRRVSGGITAKKE